MHIYSIPYIVSYSTAENRIAHFAKGGVLKTKQKYVSINGLKKQNPNKNMLEQNKDK